MAGAFPDGLNKLWWCMDQFHCHDHKHAPYNGVCSFFTDCSCNGYSYNNFPLPY